MAKITIRCATCGKTIASRKILTSEITITPCEYCVGQAYNAGYTNAVLDSETEEKPVAKKPNKGS